MLPSPVCSDLDEKDVQKGAQVCSGPVPGACGGSIGGWHVKGGAGLEFCSVAADVTVGEGV